MKYLFLSAAWINWVAALALAFFLEPFWGLFGITPLPTVPVYLHLFCVLVFLFGCGYYWASRDFEANQSIIRLGAIGKLTLVVVLILEVFLGNISWQVMIPFSADLVYGVLFLAVLRQSKPGNTPLTALRR